MSEQRFEYFAFISYNHRDRQYAEKLQKQLQRYRLPSTFVRQHPDHPKHVTPVFLDQTDLLAHEGALSLSLQARLESSNYLIVLCSPNSASSPWVNAEVEYFLSHGRKDRIIPVILDGTPHAQDPASECYPPALASLPAEEELLGISVAEYGWHGTFLRVLATILHLKMDTVIKRDAAYRRRKRILAAGLILAAAAGVFALVWHNTPHTAYYRSVIDRWAAPEGISPVSPSEKNHIPAVWKLTSLRGQIVQAERINSADQLAVDPLGFSSDPPMVHIVYDSNGNVTRKEYYDMYRRPAYTIEYSGNLRILDFVSYESGYSFALSSDAFTALLPEESLLEHSDVIRYICTYDEETGLETGRVYKRDNRGSSGGTSVADASGVWGQRFEYDEKGRLVRSWNLGRNGETAVASGGSAGKAFAYDALDRIISVTCLDPEGNPMFVGASCHTEYHWNEAGQPDEIRYYASADTNDPDSLMFTSRILFDSHGFRIGEDSFAGNGKPYPVWNGASSIRNEYDALGRTIRRTWCTAEEEPFCMEDGYASMTAEYGSTGLLTEWRAFSSDGSPAVNLSCGSHGARLFYDDSGSLIRAEYFDSSGNVSPGENGYAVIEQQFNEEHQVELIRLKDENGNPVLCREGYSALEDLYEDGHLVGIRCLDTEGNWVTGSSGAAWIKRYYTNGLLSETACFGPSGEPVSGNDGWHRRCSRYNEFSQVTEEWFEDPDGHPVNTLMGYARHLMSYDDLGRLCSEQFLKSDGSEALLPDLCYASRRNLEYGIFGITAEVFQSDSPRGGNLPSRHETTYDSRGLVVSECWLDTEGSPVANPDGNIRIDYEADSSRRQTKLQAFQRDGTVMTRETSYDDSGRICARNNSDHEITFSERFTYDGFGHIQSKILEGYLHSQPDQITYSREEYTYDLYGRITDTRYYDRSGQPVMSDGTCFHRHNVYDRLGRLIAEENYDLQDRPCDTGGWFRTEYAYDRLGNRESVTRLLTDGSKVKDPLYLILVTEVAPGSWAESVGMPVYSYILQFGEWHFSQIGKEPESWEASLSDEFRNGRRDDPSALLVTMEPLGDDLSYGFNTRTIPSGFLGITYTPIEVDASVYEDVLGYWDQYMAYMEENGID